MPAPHLLCTGCSDVAYRGYKGALNMVPEAAHDMQSLSKNELPMAGSELRQFLSKLCVAVSLTLLLFVTCEVVCFFAFRIYSRNHGSGFSINPVYRGDRKSTR